MPSSLQDRIRVKTSTLGFSTVQLGNTVDGYENFSLLGTGIFNIYYFITTGLEWEHGKGVYNSENNTITRDTIVRSSNNGSHVSLFDTSIVYLSNENDDRFIYTSNGVPPESGYFVTGNGSRFITKEISSSDIENALGYSPYDSTNPKNYITLDSLPETLLYSIDTYYDPEWISHLNPDKVEKDSPLWNAAKIQGYRISDQQPFPDQFLGWNVYANQWEPKDVSNVAGVISFNSRNGIVTLTSGDVTDALAYIPYDNTNPSGYISSGYYTASDGVVLSTNNFSMGGTGTLDQLNFSDPVKIRSAGNDIIIGQNAASDNGYTGNHSISIGTDAASYSNYYYNTFIGYNAGMFCNGGEVVGIGKNAGYNSVSNNAIYIGSNAGYSANGNNAIEITTNGSFTSRIATNYDIHIQDTIGGNTSTHRLSFGDITMTPNANVEVISTETTTIPFIAKGAVSQAANLIEAQSSSGTILFSVDNSGYISTPSSGVATWNASKLQNYPIQTGHIPSSGQFLYYDGSGWMPENISVAPSISTNFIDFKPQQNPPSYEEGRVFYDKDSATLAYYNDESGVTLNIGQENYLYVKNINASGGIPNGAVVYIDGAIGKTPTANLAIASNDASSQIVGVATMAIPLDSYGYITTQGIVHDLNTQGYAAGTAIFLSPTSSGAFTHTEPLPPNYPIKVGTIINVHNSQGSILVDPVPHYVDGNQIVGDIYARNNGNIFTGNILLNGAISGTLSTTNLTTIDSTPYSSGDCVKYIVKAKYGTAVQASEILVTSDGTESYMTEYGLIYTSGLLADISTSYSSSNIILSAQATHSNTSIHMFKILIS